MNTETSMTVHSGLPVLAPPVDRRGEPAALLDPSSGVTAAQSMCSNLHGVAQQMCYASQYGVTV